MNIDRETNIPSDKLFVGLGWDEDSKTDRKHYRRYFPMELENCKELLPSASPFNQYDLIRGQTRGAKKSLFESLKGNFKTDASGEVDTTEVMGRFKGIITIGIKDEIEPFKAKKHALVKQMISNLRDLAKFR